MKTLKNLAKKALVTLLLPIILATGKTRAASNNDTTTMFYTELIYQRGNNILDVRPFTRTDPAQEKRADILLGRKFNNWTLYGYWKADNFDREWIGFRVDRNFKLREKLNAQLQFRYFKGLNELSANHFYFMPSISRELSDKLTAGISSYGKKAEGQEPFFYVGPSLEIKLNKHLSLGTFYGLDAFGENKDIAMLSCKYKFK